MEIQRSDDLSTQKASQGLPSDTRPLKEGSNEDHSHHVDSTFTIVEAIARYLCITRNQAGTVMTADLRREVNFLHGSPAKYRSWLVECNAQRLLMFPRLDENIMISSTAASVNQNCAALDSPLISR